MKPLMQIKYITKEYLKADGQSFKAVDNVSFVIFEGETLGMIGESGCGKTTLIRCLLSPNEKSGGEVLFDGRDMSLFKKNEMFDFGRQVQPVFQNATGSLNPKMTIGENIAEPLYIHQTIENKFILKEVQELLDKVGLNRDSHKKYPHEFSGGQKQRIAIARALALRPRLLICDEPVSGLDVSVQAQIVNLLRDLQKEYRLTYFFIAHDIALIKYLSDRVAVMHQGKIVEIDETERLFCNPQHPYTLNLLCQSAFR